jgi:GAF domain-containing protein
MVPMMRGDKALGLIAITSRAATPFTDQQVALLQTFADQAVIAIENVRLFNETKEALEQQTATGEILRVISSSPTDIQPVFDAIASSALRLCDGVASFVFRHDGTLIHLAAFDSAEGVDLQPLRHIFPAPPERVTFAGRVVTTARLLYIADIELDPDAPPTLVDFARANGFRSIFATPMLRDGHTIGVIAVTHRDVDGFTPKQGALLETFANQAVIAIENVRLFNETKEALEQQTATADILRVISSSPTDVQPVFDAIIQSAVTLCGALHGSIWRFDAAGVAFVGHHNVPGDEVAALRVNSPRGIETMIGPVGVSIREGSVINVPDIETSPHIPEASAIRERMRLRGARSIAVVPMQHETEVVGAISVTHSQVGAFSPGRLGSPQDLRQSSRHRHRERPALYGAATKECSADAGARTGQ